MSSQQQAYRCRGLRKWCGRRCEAVDTAAPAQYPHSGFYCGLHSYQKPKVLPDGAMAFESEAIEQHVRRRTSFVAPEAAVAGELMAAPGLVRDRPGAPSSVTALGVINWLMERRSLSEDAAKAYAQRMVALEVLLPVSGAKAFNAADRNSLYRVRPAGGASGSGARG